MSTITPTQSPPAPSAPPAIPAENKIPASDLYRMSVREYERIGPLLDSEKVELINGLVVDKVTQGDPHSTVDDLCRAALAAVIRAGWYIRSNKPVRLPLVSSKPEPDQAVVRGAIKDYHDESPGAEDVALVVEISATTLAKDRGLVWTYGAARIPFYWLVNMPDRLVEVYSDPTGSGYAKRTDYKPGDLVPVVIDGVEVGSVAVSDLLP